MRQGVGDNKSGRRQKATNEGASTQQYCRSGRRQMAVDEEGSMQVSTSEGRDKRQRMTRKGSNHRSGTVRKEAEAEGR